MRCAKVVVGDGAPFGASVLQPRLLSSSRRASLEVANKGLEGLGRSARL